MLARTVGITSRVAPGVGSAIAEKLWFHPKTRRAGDVPDGATAFSLSVAGRDLTGYTLGTGAPVLLLHGWGGAASDLGAIARVVGDGGFRAVAPDLPGHGSDRGSRTDLFVMAHVVDAVGALFGSPVTVVAHSFGAPVAFTAFPTGGPKRIVFVAPALRAERHYKWFGDVLGLGKRAQHRFVRRVERFAGPHVGKILRGEGDIPGAQIMILHDPDDAETAYADSVAFAASRRAVALEPIPGAGHRRILEDQRTLRLISSFVERPVKSVHAE